QLANQLIADMPDLSDARLDNALTLHITALTDLLAVGYGETPRQLTKSAEQQLVGHERDYMRRVADRRGLLVRGVISTRLDPDECADESWRALQRATGGLILLGQCNLSHAHAVGELASSEHAVDIVAWLAALYPPPFGKQGIGAIQPDRLAELLLGDILTGNP